MDAIREMSIITKDNKSDFMQFDFYIPGYMKDTIDKIKKFYPKRVNDGTIDYEICLRLMYTLYDPFYK